MEKRGGGRGENGGGGKKTCQEELAGIMTDSLSLFRQSVGGAGLGMEMEENWRNHILMCLGLQTSLALLH